MPNTLAHAGAQGLVTRTAVSGADLRWIYLACVIPDLPWILRRVVCFAVPSVDPILLRSYVIIQASLIGCLLFCAAAALLSSRFWRVWALLGGNAVLHLIIDAMQTKWANGAHFFAPFSWELTNWGFFWPESIVTYALTALGLLYILWHWRSSWSEKLDLAQLTGFRLAGTGGLLVGYFTLPLLLLHGPIEANTHYLKTLDEPRDRTGRYVEIDRARYISTQEGAFLEYFSGRARVESLKIQPPATVSIRGVFGAKDTIRVIEHHVHAGQFRDYPSYLGLTLISVIWVGASVRKSI